VSALLAMAACGSSSDAGPSDGGAPGEGGSSGSSGDAGGDGGRVDGPGVGPDGASFDAGPDVAFDAPIPIGDGRVTLKLPDGNWHRVIAKAGGAVEDLTTPMNAISAGSDNFVNTSKDGDWLVANSGRFSCATGSCLDLFAGALASGAEVKPAGQSVQSADARPAVASGGGVIVYPATGGPHSVDLYAIKKTLTGWSAPVLLTAASPFAFHHDVSVASDGTRAVFDCGADPYAQPPTSMCEVATDGTGFQEVLSPSDGPDHGASHALHHPDYTPQGDFVFEADWPSEQIWKVARGSKAPVQLSAATETDDNSPCVLPNGRVASLWLGRPGNNGSVHELKVMNADGSGSVMVMTGTDIVDIGIGCGN
jgi:hypothetical protein